MEKPISIKVKETTDKLIQEINVSELPTYIIIKILEDLTRQVVELDNELVEQYIKEQNMNKTKKGSDK